MEIALLAAILITLLGGGAIVLWLAGIAIALYVFALLWGAFADHIGRPIVALLDRSCESDAKYVRIGSFDVSRGGIVLLLLFAGLFLVGSLAPTN